MISACFFSAFVAGDTFTMNEIKLPFCNSKRAELVEATCILKLIEHNVFTVFCCCAYVLVVAIYTYMFMQQDWLVQLYHLCNQEMI